MNFQCISNEEISSIPIKVSLSKVILRLTKERHEVSTHMPPINIHQSNPQYYLPFGILTSAEQALTQWQHNRRTPNNAQRIPFWNSYLLQRVDAYHITTYAKYYTHLEDLTPILSF